MKKLLEFLATSLVEKPQAVTVEANQEGDFLNLGLEVDPEDLKIIIGKHGKTIKAIRHLLKIKAAKQDQKFNFTLIEEKT